MDITQQVKCAQLDLLEELHRLCEKNGISYFLVGGTLIGAIRHKGFIPWDDDIDVGMLRGDYERFRQVCGKELDSAYALYDWHSDPGSPNPFLKLRIRGTHYPEKISAGSNMVDGIFIDIFPFDSTPAEPKLRRRQARQMRLCRKILLVRCGFSLGEGSALKKLVYGTLKLLSRVRSVEGWKKKADAIQTRYNHLDTVTVTNMGGSYSYERESHPRAQLEKTVLHPFEQGQYRIPEGYDDLLRRCYGDYMQLPPEDQRVGIHQVQGVDFGSYQIRCRL